MKGSDFIWRLVRSLQKRELEGFYRVAAIRETHGNSDSEPQYVQFFQALIAQKEYNEAELKRQFPVGNFSELKGRLAAVIFKSIWFYDPSPSKTRSVDCSGIHFLTHKGFLPEAWRKLARTKAQAEKQEAFLTLLELLDLENELLLRDDSIKAAESHINQLATERQAVLDKYSNLQAYIGFYQQVHSRIKKQYTPRGMMAHTYADMIAGNGLVNGTVRPLSMRAQFYLNRLRYIGAFLRGEIADSLLIAREIVQLFDASDFLLTEYQEEYIQRKFHLTASFIHEGQYDEARKHLNTFYQKRNSDPYHFFYYYFAQIDILLLSGQTDNLETVLASAEQNIQRFLAQLPQSMLYLMWLRLARAFHSLRDFGKAIQFVRLIIDNPAKDYRVDVQGSARMILVLLYFQQDDVDGMEYAISLASQYLYRRKSMFPFEQALLKFFRLCVRTDDTAKRLLALRSLQSQVTELLSDDTPLRAFYYFDYRQWIDDTVRELETVSRETD